MKQIVRFKPQGKPLLIQGIATETEDEFVIDSSSVTIYPISHDGKVMPALPLPPDSEILMAASVGLIQVIGGADYLDSNLTIEPIE